MLQRRAGRIRRLAVGASYGIDAVTVGFPGRHISPPTADWLELVQEALPHAVRAVEQILE